MIAIINQGVKGKQGKTLYSLKINHQLIGEFWHRREDGLEKCLIEASKEAKKAELARVQELINNI
jgi:hypothetical protein